MTWQYLAGFTDGDGCITRECSKRTYAYARLRWAQRLDAGRVLEEIADFLRAEGLKVTARNFSVARQGHRYPQAELAISNADDTRQALEAMLPYLVVKRDRAIEALALLRIVHRFKQQFGNKYRRHLQGVA